MVQWLAHPTSNQGDAGSILTHGTLRFSFKKDQSVVVHCYWLVTTSLDFQPSSYTQKYVYIYIYIYTYCRQYCFGLLDLISEVLMSGMEVKLIKPPQMSHTCGTSKPCQSAQTSELVSMRNC